MSLKILFIINPISGGKKKQDLEAAIRNYFKPLDHIIELYQLSGSDDTRSIEHYIKLFNPDRVVAVGGDGTIKLLAEILKETSIPMGIIPAGSANGMAKELNIPFVVEAALKIVLEGEPKKIDLIKINEEELCIHLSDIGLNAMIVKYYDQSKTRGWWSYAKALFRVLIEKQKFRCTIKTDEGTIKRKAYMVVLANATQYGMGGVINPEGDVADNYFEVVIVRKLNVFAVVNGLLRHKRFDPQRIEVLKTKTLDLKTQKRVHFQIDGEYMGKVANLQARILPGILNILLPNDVA